MSWVWRNWGSREWTEFTLASLIGVFTIVNAVAMVIYVCTFDKSIVETSRQTDKLICAAKTQAAAGQQSADAADRFADSADVQANAAKKATVTFKNQVALFKNVSHRVAGGADVRLTRHIPLFNLGPNVSPYVVLYVVNFGGSDATSIEVAATLEFRENSFLPTQAQYKHPSQFVQIVPARPLSPLADKNAAYRQEHPFGELQHRITARQNKFVAYSDRQMRLFVWGVIRYGDLAGDGWTTEFCRYVSATDVPSGEWGGLENQQFHDCYEQNNP